MKRIVSVFSVVAFTLVFLVSGTALGTDYSVPDDYDTIQEALDAAGDGDTITVSDGTYTGANNRELDFDGKATTLVSENGPVNCIIDCEGIARAFIFDNGETSESKVIGFTIKNGLSFAGGAIYCTEYDPPGDDGPIPSSPTIKNCIIRDGQTFGGGGIACNGSSPTIVNCTFYGNKGVYWGGAIYANSTATKSSHPKIENCILWNNSAPIGPEICLANSSFITVSYSTVKGGNAGIGSYQGGGTVYWQDGSTCILPMFKNGDGIPFSLWWISPCVDAGSPNSDYSDEPWPNGRRIDMGAHGNTQTAAQSRARRFFDWVPDFAGTNAPELVRMGIDLTTNAAVAEVYDASSGNHINNVNFGSACQPQALKVIDDFADSSAPELAMLRYNAGSSNNAVMALVRDASTGNLLSSVNFTRKHLLTQDDINWPVDLEIMINCSKTSAPELVCLDVDESGLCGFQVKDASSGATILGWTQFFAEAAPVDMEITTDISGAAPWPEVVCLARMKDGKVKTRLRDTYPPAYPYQDIDITLEYFDGSKKHTPLDLEIIPDFGSLYNWDVLAVLGARYDAEDKETKVIVSMREACYGSDEEQVEFSPLLIVNEPEDPDDLVNLVDLEIVESFGGTSAPELVVLYDIRSPEGRAEVKDASSGALVGRCAMYPYYVEFASGYFPFGIKVKPGGSPEVAMLGVDPEGGIYSVLGQVKDLSTGSETSRVYFNPDFETP